MNLMKDGVNFFKAPNFPNSSKPKKALERTCCKHHSPVDGLEADGLEADGLEADALEVDGFGSAKEMEKDLTWQLSWVSRVETFIFPILCSFSLSWLMCKCAEWKNVRGKKSAHLGCSRHWYLLADNRWGCLQCGLEKKETVSTNKMRRKTVVFFVKYQNLIFKLDWNLLQCF